MSKATFDDGSSIFDKDVLQSVWKRSVEGQLGETSVRLVFPKGFGLPFENSEKGINETCLVVLKEGDNGTLKWSGFGNTMTKKPLTF